MKRVKIVLDFVLKISYITGMKTLALIVLFSLSAFTQVPVLNKPFTTPRINFSSDGLYSDTTFGRNNLYFHRGATVDTVIVENKNGSNTKTKLILQYNVNFSNPANLQVLGYDSVGKVWKPITQTGSGGGGGPVKLNDLLSPTGGTALTMGSNPISFTYSGGGASPGRFIIQDNDAAATAPSFEVVGTQASSGTVFRARRGGNGIALNWDGTNTLLSPYGPNANINATLFRGNWPLLAGDLPTTVAFENAVNAFTANNTISANFAGNLLDVNNSNTANTSVAIAGTIGSGEAILGKSIGVGNGVHGQTVLGRGVWGHATNSGIGGYFSASNSGTALVADIGGSPYLSITSNGLSILSQTSIYAGNLLTLANAGNTTTYGIRTTGTTLGFIYDPLGANSTTVRVGSNGLIVDFINSFSSSGITFSDNLVPDIASTRDLGTAAKPYRKIYVDNMGGAYAEVRATAYISAATDSVWFPIAGFDSTQGWVGSVTYTDDRLGTGGPQAVLGTPNVRRHMGGIGIKANYDWIIDNVEVSFKYALKK